MYVCVVELNENQEKIYKQREGILRNRTFEEILAAPLSSEGLFQMQFCG